MVFNSTLNAIFEKKLSLFLILICILTIGYNGKSTFGADNYNEELEFEWSNFSNMKLTKEFVGLYHLSHSLGVLSLPCPGVFVSATTTQNTLPVQANNINMDVVCLVIETGGGTDLPVVLHSITFSTQGSTNPSNMTNARVFFTGTSGSFSTKTQFGQTIADPSGVHTITDNISLYAGTNYFWFAYDISKDAVAGDVVDFSVESFQITDENGSSTNVPNPPNPVGSRPIVEPEEYDFQFPCPLIVPSMSYACTNNEKCYIRTIRINGAAPFYDWKSCLQNHMVNPLGGTNLLAWFDFRPGGASANHQNYMSQPIVNAATTVQFQFTHFVDTWIMGSPYAGLMHIDWNKNNIYESNEFYPPPGQGRINQNGSVSFDIPPDALGLYTMTILFMTDVGFNYENLKSTNQLCGIACSEAWHVCGAEVLLFPLLVLGPGVTEPGDTSVQNAPCYTVPPVVTTPVNYNINAIANPLSATGTNLLWYANSHGGIGASTAFIPSTSIVGSSYYYVSQTIDDCESSRRQIEVNINEPGSCGVVCPNDTDVCLNGSLFMFEGYTPSGGIFTGVGTSGNNGSTYNPNTSGTHTITYTYASDYCEFEVIVYELPQLICPEDITIALLSPPVQLSAVPENGTYSGNGLQGNLFNPSVAGIGQHNIIYNYTDPITLCSSTCSFVIIVIDEIVCPPDQTVCMNEPSFALSGEFPTGGVYTGVGVSGNTFSPSLAGIGIHSITYSDGIQSCEFEILVLPYPNVNLSQTITVCEKSVLIVIESGYEQYIWSSNDSTNSITVTESGSYSVTVTDIEGCSVNAQVYVTLAVPPVIDIGNDTTLCSGLPFILDAEISNAHYAWSNGANSQSIKVNMSGLYAVTVTDIYGCIVSDELFVTFINCECNLYIPSAFSPDNNGVNDTFRPMSDCEFIAYELQIFNRWGQLLFSSVDSNQKWDGMLNGKPLPQAVYVYTLVYRFETSHGVQQRTGNISIVR